MDERRETVPGVRFIMLRTQGTVPPFSLKNIFVPLACSSAVKYAFCDGRHRTIETTRNDREDNS